MMQSKLNQLLAPATLFVEMKGRRRPQSLVHCNLVKITAPGVCVETITCFLHDIDGEFVNFDKLIKY